MLKSPLLASELVIEPVALAQPVAGKRQKAKVKRQKAHACGKVVASAVFLLGYLA